jgi:hypothetical protein
MTIRPEVEVMARMTTLVRSSGGHVVDVVGAALGKA